MHPDLTALLVRNTNTMPVYMAPAHASALIDQIIAAEPTAAQSPRRINAFFRALRRKSDVEHEANAEDGPLIPEAYAPLWMGEPDEALDLGMSLKDGVATINLDAAIPAKAYWYCGKFYHGYDSLDLAIKVCLEDERVRGIFLRMDSPGGVVHDGINVLTRTIRAAEKPIWVHADMACSAAYWIAAQTGRIFASSTGLVGSIGACIVHGEMSGMLNKQGIKITPIQFGEFKTDGAGFKPLSDDARAHLQSFVDEAGVEFVSAVAEGRPELTPDAILDQGARWYPAQHSVPEMSGLALKLCDEILSEEDAFRTLVDHTSGAAGAPGIGG